MMTDEEREKIRALMREIGEIVKDFCERNHGIRARRKKIRKLGQELWLGVEMNVGTPGTESSPVSSAEADEDIRFLSSLGIRSGDDPQ